MEFAILNLLKTMMYDFHYNYIKQKYSDSTLLFADTDFLTYQIRSVNVCEDFCADKQLFILSGYEKEIRFYNDENKKVICKMKDELNWEIIQDNFKAKMYSLETKKEKMRR